MVLITDIDRIAPLPALRTSRTIEEGSSDTNDFLNSRPKCLFIGMNNLAEALK